VSVVDVFPRRPLALAEVPGRARNRLLLLLLAALLVLPSLYWGNIAWQRHQLRQDLRARGVPVAEAIDLDGDCYSRRSRANGRDTPIDCWLQLRYRAEAGGEIRTADVHLDGGMPIFTPPAVYDPQDPGRVMLKPELDRDTDWDEALGPILLLLLPLGVLTVWFFGGRRGLAKAAADPHPLIVPIEQVNPQPGRVYIRTRPLGAARASVDSFVPPAKPLLVRPPAGSPPEQQWVLALQGAKRVYALDDRLALLDLTEAERSAVLAAAWG